jgi:hypothetical protein
VDIQCVCARVTTSSSSSRSKQRRTSQGQCGHSVCVRDSTDLFSWPKSIGAFTFCTIRGIAEVPTIFNLGILYFTVLFLVKK